ncbi:FKBP-type peptidyl-prolyl cis-trans isomerase SlyD [mine drainage metagenome]|uniref:peptidylprolyl isomerase n=1 Tax=mine drainage metagenome TaxID=410659 RepID=A0A1J5R307_9ZZZZ
MSTVVAKDHIVTLDYRVTGPQGELVDAGKKPLVYLHGGYGALFPVIEDGLDGKARGAAFRVELQPHEAYGDFDPALIRREPRALFPEDVAPGRVFEQRGPDGEDITLFLVTEVDDDEITLDGNHPLAGVPLVFSCIVTDIRPATPEELDEGGPLTDDDDDGEDGDEED